jgi:hypothetical protein
MPAPIIAGAIALAPVLARWIPDIIGWLGGDDAEQTAGRIVSIVERVAGSTDPTVVAATLEDPQRGGELALSLARFQAEREAKREEQLTVRLTSMMADMADARATTVRLAQAGSKIAWLAPAVCTLVFGLFSFVVVAEVFGYGQTMTEATRRLLDYLAIAAAGYAIGSSAGSAAKDGRLAASGAGLVPAIVDAAAAPPRAPEGRTAADIRARPLFARRD